MKLMGIQHKLSTSYHPQTNGSSEQMNKTVIQCLHFHVKHNQKCWAKVLPKVCFNIMNTFNASMGLSPFMLKTGRSLRLLPPLISTTPPSDGSINITVAQNFINEMEEETNTAKDCLLAAKIQQAHKVNKDQNADPAYKVGDQVLLAMAHQRRDYASKRWACCQIYATLQWPIHCSESLPGVILLHPLTTIFVKSTPNIPHLPLATTHTKQQ